jgi:uncharacterized membrane protein YdfJ with MMPL/SSD domain
MAQLTPDEREALVRRTIRIVGLAVVFAGMAVIAGWSHVIETARFASMVSGIAFGLMLREE